MGCKCLFAFVSVRSCLLALACISSSSAFAYSCQRLSGICLRVLTFACAPFSRPSPHASDFCLVKQKIALKIIFFRG